MDIPDNLNKQGEDPEKQEENNDQDNNLDTNNPNKNNIDKTTNPFYHYQEIWKSDNYKEWEKIALNSSRSIGISQMLVNLIM